MNMPDRYFHVSDLCIQNAMANDFTVPGDTGPVKVAFPQGEENDAYRLHFLKSVIIPHLNALDNGRWGVLTKQEQNDRVPVDVLMWRDTNEFADCMTGVGAMWQPFRAG